MRFLVDECTGPSVAQWLRNQSHVVYSVYDESRGMTDEEILAKAHAENWILITNDKDFGEKVYREKHPHCGVIFLRLQDERPAAKIEAIEKLLDTYEEQLPDAFVVVTETQVQISVLAKGPQTTPEYAPPAKSEVWTPDPTPATMRFRNERGQHNLARFNTALDPGRGGVQSSRTNPLRELPGRRPRSVSVEQGIAAGRNHVAPGFPVEFPPASIPGLLGAQRPSTPAVLD